MDQLKPTVKRDLSLFSSKAWQIGYQNSLYKKLNFSLPIYLHYDGRRVNFYHKEKDFEYFKQVITQNLIKDKQAFQKLNKQFKKDVLTLKKLSFKINLSEVSKLSNLISNIMAFYLFVVSDSFAKQIPEILESRALSEDILYKVDEKIERAVKKLLKKNHLSKELSHLLTKNEIKRLISFKKIDIKSIYKRGGEYILSNNKLQTQTTFKKFCTTNKLINPEDNSKIDQINSLKGSIACSGKVTGKAKIVHAGRHLIKVKKGDILISIMTSTNYIAAFKKAAAVITDEGGVTCHAAILARELNKPCITGTKIATKVFADGDLIQVDANLGTVTRVSLH